MSAFLTRIWGGICDLVWPLKTALPQKTGPYSRRRRGWQLAYARDRYQFNYTHMPALAMVDSVPILDELNFHWLVAVMERVLVALENRASLELSPEHAKVHHEKHAKLKSLKAHGLAAVAQIKELVHDSLRFDLRMNSQSNAATAIEDYDNLFRSIGLPPIAKDYMNDFAFANMRVAGPNPVMLQRMTAHDDRFPITDAMFQIAAPGDSLDAAMGEARLYIADYKMLDGAPAGNFPNGQKYLAAPIALFVVDKSTKLLKPVAIQCQQKPGTNNPIFTPNDGWNWQIAKTFVEIADGNVHETMTHLGRTHLTMEPFVVSTLRQLADAHPINRLLYPHFEGTLTINAASWKHLIAGQGGVEKLCSASLDAARGLAIKSVQTVDVMNSMLPRTFAERGVEDATALPNYPYRDDSMLYWNAIGDWVKSYVRLYYTSETDVQQDSELQAWSRELASNDGGRLRGMPNGGSIQTINQLTDVLSFVVYTCSVQHAAVNFPQYSCMSYVPNMPLASYRPVPTQKFGATEADYLAMLPPMDMAELQVELGYILGDVYYTQLGKYNESHFDHDKRVQDLLKQFQQSVTNAGETIGERNEQRERPYQTLRPEGIPQSINV